MNKSLNDKKLVLGSKSPRRSQLLSEAGFIFETRIQDVDESFDDTIPTKEVAKMLAERKALALRETLTSQEILITADSVVILDDIIYNKPENYDDGVRILTLLANRTHIVATGVCILTAQQSNSFTVITEVTFSPMNQEEIAFYLNTFKPYDKAGAYGIQDWIGLCKVQSIHGSYSNVMGLPMKEVYDALAMIAK